MDSKRRIVLQNKPRLITDDKVEAFTHGTQPKKTLPPNVKGYLLGYQKQTGAGLVQWDTWGSWLSILSPARVSQLKDRSVPWGPNR